MKHSPWNEIDLDMFYEIFNMYWAGQFKDKILEIANLSEFSYLGTRSSMFLGHSININEYKEANTSAATIVDFLNKEEFFKSYKLSTCIITTKEMRKQGPMITPLVEGDHYNILLWSYFDFKKEPSSIGSFSKNFPNSPSLIKRPIQFWHFYDPKLKIRYVGLDKEERDKFKLTNPQLKQMVLIRTVDHEYWKTLVDNSIKTGQGIAEEYENPGYPERNNINII